jgi:hypothetical protein
MTEPLIVPLIPPRARPDDREQGKPATPRRLPVACPSPARRESPRPRTTCCTGSAGWTSQAGSPTGP